MDEMVTRHCVMCGETIHVHRDSDAAYGEIRCDEGQGCDSSPADSVARRESMMETIHIGDTISGRSWDYRTVTGKVTAFCSTGFYVETGRKVYGRTLAEYIDSADAYLSADSGATVLA